MQKFCYMLIASMLISGCSQTDQGQESNQNGKAKVTQVKNTNIKEANRETGEQIAKRLSNLAVKIPHVNDATSVVLGRYAIVGIDIDQDIERSQVGTIKYSVGEALRHDPDGARALIVADPDINERIREVAADIQNGKPIRGILNELSDITSRVIPEVPFDKQAPTPTKTMNNEEKSLDKKGERQMLEKEQNQQSNGHKNKNE